MSLLPRRGPEALEYIPLGKKRSRSGDDQEEDQPKKVKASGNSFSEGKDGFTYMGRWSYALSRRRWNLSDRCPVCRRCGGGVHRRLLLRQRKSRRPGGHRGVLGGQPSAVRRGPGFSSGRVVEARINKRALLQERC